MKSVSRASPGRKLELSVSVTVRSRERLRERVYKLAKLPFVTRLVATFAPDNVENPKQTVVYLQRGPDAIKQARSMLSQRCQLVCTVCLWGCAEHPRKQRVGLLGAAAPELPTHLCELIADTVVDI